MNLETLITHNNILSRATIDELLETAGPLREITIIETKETCVDFLNNFFSGALATPDIILLRLNTDTEDAIAYLEMFERLYLTVGKNLKIIVMLSGSINYNLPEKYATSGHFYKRILSDSDIQKFLEPEEAAYAI